jgi:hypothetical protein
MVRRKSGRKRRTSRKTVTKIVGGKRCVCRTLKRGAKGGKGALKGCIVAAIKRTKFTTPKSARRAFAAAAKKCRKALTGVAPRRRRRTGVRKARRTTRRRKSPARMNIGSWSGNLPRRAERMSHSKYWLNR